jgi:hypothetical protein
VSATADDGVRSGWAHRKYSRSVSSALVTVPAGGAVSTRISRARRAVSERVMSR